jgi:hypothetical protein
MSPRGQFLMSLDTRPTPTSGPASRRCSETSHGAGTGASPASYVPGQTARTISASSASCKRCSALRRRVVDHGLSQSRTRCPVSSNPNSGPRSSRRDRINSGGPTSPTCGSNGPSSFSPSCWICSRARRSAMRLARHSTRGYRTMADVIAHLPHFMEIIYNNNRQHSALDYRSPNAVEADHALTLSSGQISTT